MIRDSGDLSRHGGRTGIYRRKLRKWRRLRFRDPNRSRIFPRISQMVADSESYQNPVAFTPRSQRARRSIPPPIPSSRTWRPSCKVQRLEAIGISPSALIRGTSGEVIPLLPPFPPVKSDAGLVAALPRQGNLHKFGLLQFGPEPTSPRFALLCCEPVPPARRTVTALASLVPPVEALLVAVHRTLTTRTPETGP